MFAGLALGPTLVAVGTPMFFIGRERQRRIKSFTVDHTGLRF